MILKIVGIVDPAQLRESTTSLRNLDQDPDLTAENTTSIIEEVTTEEADLEIIEAREASHENSTRE